MKEGKKEEKKESVKGRECKEGEGRGGGEKGKGNYGIWKKRR